MPTISQMLLPEFDSEINKTRKVLELVPAQPDFTPDRLAAEISALAAEPTRLSLMAVNARSVGRLDAAERLAEATVERRGSHERVWRPVATV